MNIRNKGVRKEPIPNSVARGGGRPGPGVRSRQWLADRRGGRTSAQLVEGADRSGTCGKGDINKVRVIVKDLSPVFVIVKLILGTFIWIEKNKDMHA
ncbi:unnamed protein product, partial [Iphiclides podalirius]